MNKEMSDLQLSMVLRKVLQAAVKKSVSIYACSFDDSYAIFFFSPINKLLKFNENLSSSVFVTTLSSFKGPVQLAGNNNDVFALDSEGDLYRCFYVNSLTVNYKWTKFENLKFKNVLAITEAQRIYGQRFGFFTSQAEYKESFACLGVLKSGEKQLRIFEVDCLPNFEDYTFEELNANDSENYYLKTVARSFECVNLLVSDNFSGKTYLCSNNGQRSLIYSSNIRLISAMSIASEDCLSLWFENGKLFFHYFSQSCINNVLFLNKRVICVEKCFCNDKCFLWSDGSNLHHTEINFSEGKPNMTNFKLKNDIVGVFSLIKVGCYIIAQTINDNLYELSPSSEEKKELIKTNTEVFSQIYNESLKIKHIYKDIEVASEYLRFKEIIQNNLVDVKVNSQENFLKIKNNSGMTFRKEFWRIEVNLSDLGRKCVKVVDLETDFVNEMMVKVENPFQSDKKMKVYLVGQFNLEMLSICIGIISNEVDPEKKSLKRALNEIKRKNNPIKNSL